MVVVHRAFRREFPAAAALIRGTAEGDTRRAKVVADHLRLGLAGLHMHHTGEDIVLWPLLLERAAPSTGLVETMQAQHHAVDTHVEAIMPALDAWEAAPAGAAGERLAQLCEQLTAALVEHLDLEEREILPLASRYVTAAEWNQMGEHGKDSMSPSQLPIMFGWCSRTRTTRSARRCSATSRCRSGFCSRPSARGSSSATSAACARHDHRGTGLDLGVARGAAGVPLPGELGSPRAARVASSPRSDSARDTGKAGSTASAAEIERPPRTASCGCRIAHPLRDARQRGQRVAEGPAQPRRRATGRATRRAGRRSRGSSPSSSVRVALMLRAVARVNGLPSSRAVATPSVSTARQWRGRPP